ncbi:hypothetical protein ACFVH9_07540 [Streptomyces hirsutus]|uniref:hypothetical protein n=1 Tax=Streptomyces hirsutus TaxID=35620 RepID=UPI003643BA23
MSLGVCAGISGSRVVRKGLATAPVGLAPFNLLAPAGRLDSVLTAWGRGHLAEVPAGITVDVLAARTREPAAT